MLRYAPSFDSLEARVVLSAFSLTTHAYRATQAEIRSALGRLARTRDWERASIELSEAASRIPFGGSHLLPAWQAHLSGISAEVPGSGLVARRRMLLSLDSFLRGEIRSGTLVVRGEAGRLLSRPRLAAPSQVLTFVNSTRLELRIELFEDDELIQSVDVDPNRTAYLVVPPTQANTPLRVRPVVTVTVSTTENPRWTSQRAVVSPGGTYRVELQDDTLVILRVASGFATRQGAWRA